MSHATKAASRAARAALIAVVLGGPWSADAQALDYPGGTPAPTASVSRASVNPVRAGGASAPSTHGTGGTEYAVLASKPRLVRKALPRKSSRPARHLTSKPRPKPTPKPKPAPPAPSPAAEIGLPAGTPTPAQTAGEGAVFPVLGPHGFGDAANRFGASRTGHIHQGQDVLAAEGLTVAAPLEGTILAIAYQAAGAGWYAAERTARGLDFFYAHCQAGSLAVTVGEVVQAGQPICRVGQTGDATGPHLHFEIWVGGWQAAAGRPIDPLPYLEAWDPGSGG